MVLIRQETDSESFYLSVCLSLFPQKDEPDAFKELGTGNRIATWLFYVSIFSGLEGEAK